MSKATADPIGKPRVGADRSGFVKPQVFGGGSWSGRCAGLMREAAFRAGNSARRWVTILLAFDVVCLSACAAVDRKTASDLGLAGENATQALSAQTSAAQQTVDGLPQLWAVRETLVCASTRPNLHAACLSGVAKTPPPELSHQVATISDALAKRKLALDALHQAYGTFVDLSRYDAGQQAAAALKATFDDVNAFTAAAASLTPGGVAAAPISTTIERTVGGGVAIYANHRQDQLILAANADLLTANQALFTGLDQEKAAVDSLLQSQSAEETALVQAGYDAGLIPITEVLTPVFQQADPDIQLTPPAAASADVADAAAKLVIAAQGRKQLETASKTYDDGLSALHSVAAQHLKLAKGETPNLSQVEDAIADLKTDLSSYPSSSSKK